MTEGKPRLARLTAIITQLQSRPLVTAREIAEKHRISIRTVYRDIRTLEQSGIPIVTEEGRGYAIMEGYKLPPVMFTEEEANALITAEQLINKNSDQSFVTYYQQALTKVKSVLRHNQKAKSDFLADRIQVRDKLNNDETSNHLITLQSAIANFKLLRVKYLSLDGKSSLRFVEPFALYTTRNNWVLVAFCKSRDDFRAFRLDRIQELTSTGENFKPHNITLEKYLENCKKNW